MKTGIKTENRNPAKKVDLAMVRRVAASALAGRGKSGAYLNIVFVTSQRIRALNMRYFRRDAATDVIAFPAAAGFPEGGSEAGEKGKGKNKKEFLGDIAISSDRAQRNARVYGVSFAEEIALYVIHGILHLTGYEDVSRAGREKMRKAENALFEKNRSMVRPKSVAKR
jgi:probable rRNA maturation factor